MDYTTMLAAQQFGQLLTALVLALIIGWNREKAARSAGLRTFPLVAVASCGYVMIGDFVLHESPDAQARILQGLMTGIGFVGGGAIIKEGGSVEGTATAASIWNTGAIGAAVAYHRYDFALVLTAVNFLVFAVLGPVKDTAALEKTEDEA